MIRLFASMETFAGAMRGAPESFWGTLCADTVKNSTQTHGDRARPVNHRENDSASTHRHLNTLHTSAGQSKCDLCTRLKSHTSNHRHHNRDSSLIRGSTQDCIYRANSPNLPEIVTSLSAPESLCDFNQFFAPPNGRKRPHPLQFSELKISLQIDPKMRSGSKAHCKTQRRIRRNRARTVHDLIDPARRYSDIFRNPIFRDLKGN